MTARERRMIVIGAAVLVVAAAIRLVPSVATRVRARLEGTRERALIAQRAERIVLEAARPQARLGEQARAVVGLAPRLLAVGSVAEGGATLGAELNTVALRHRLAIRRVDPAPDSTAGPFARIELRLQAEGDVEGLYRFLYDIEHGQLLLSVTSLELSAEPPAGVVERVRLVAVVRGWMLRKEREPS